MKINGITASNFCGIRHAVIEMKKPVLLLTGYNGAGKSSLLDGIKLAVTGVPSRVKLKKDYGLMIKEGSKAGRIAVTLDGSYYNYDLKEKSGHHLKIDDCPALPFVLDAKMFADADLEARRNILFFITGKKPTPELIVKRLLERGCESDKVELIKPSLKLGFEAGCKIAKNNTSESRGAWRAITGETYGDNKGDGWIAPLPEDFDVEKLNVLKAELQTVETDHDSNSVQLGMLEQQWREANANQARVIALREKADKLPRYTTKLETDKDSLEQLENTIRAVTAMNCPCCDARLAVKGGQLEKVGLIGLANQLPEYQKSREMMIRAITNDNRDIADAESAKAELETLTTVDTQTMLNNIDALRIRLNALKADRSKLQAEVFQLEKSKLMQEQATSKTSQAATHHADAQAWSKIAEALSPEGIQAELLTDVLKSVNMRLRQSADDTEWMQVAIDADMSITANGRVYALLSESEKWRVDAHIVEMISHLSGLKLMLIDRMDVLDMPSRGQCLGWLDLLASEGDVDTIIVAATLKEMPKVLPPTFDAYWLAGGEFHNETVTAVAA